ncbi:hypothetical protein GCM10010840_31280 [Deinococcus aerolatus]|uniref:Lipoprotein n=1 Tax=Deinococcus aerolatus TaxID=522487 RepID=A0ABQ2GFH3_9DEIO|nr:hypothetical protein [Deinococcus aerolatus]GGL90954.1 hypothetical protein GCM10010840_31280 [Deinococcus aerolatus]
MRPRWLTGAVLLLATALCGCQPTHTQVRVQPPQAAPLPLEWTEAHAYMADVRAALNVAYLSDREITVSGDCDSPRFEVIPQPPTLTVQQCRVFMTSTTDFRVEARFGNGQSWVADAAGIHPVEPGTLRLMD